MKYCSECGAKLEEHIANRLGKIWKVLFDRGIDPKYVFLGAKEQEEHTAWVRENGDICNRVLEIEVVKVNKESHLSVGI